MTELNEQYPGEDSKQSSADQVMYGLTGSETDMQDRKVTEPIPVPKFLGLLTDPTISVFVDFIRGFRADFTARESLAIRILRSFIRVMISVFLLTTLISAFLFVVSQGLDQFKEIPERWERLFESAPASECELKIPGSELMIESSESVQCEATTEMPNQVETESVDSMEADNPAENQSTNPDSDQETQ